MKASPMIKRLWQLTLLLPLLVQGAVVHPANAADVVETETQLLAMDVGEGHMIRLDKAASSVFIADSAVAEAQAMTPQMIFVFGRGKGKTTLFAVDDNEQVVASFVLEISDEVSVVRGGDDDN